MDWTEKEQFADFLIAYSKCDQYDFLEKSIAIYNHIQTDSKTFSFEIISKIAATK